MKKLHGGTTRKNFSVDPVFFLSSEEKFRQGRSSANGKLPGTLAALLLVDVVEMEEWGVSLIKSVDKTAQA